MGSNSPTTKPAELLLFYPGADTHVLGRKSGRLHVFFYQFGGSSHSGLPITSDGVGGWRCLAVEKLSQVELSVDAWHTALRAAHQTCIDDVDFDADAQREEEPQ
jgi:hypothetical protein